METRIKWTRDLELETKLLPKEILILLKTVLYFKLFGGAM